MIACDGFYEDGLTSRLQPSRLQWLDGTVQITFDSDQPPITVSQNEFRVSDRLGSLPRRISLGEDRAFVTHDHAAADRLQRQLQGDSATAALHALEGRLSVVLLSLALVIGLLAGAFWWGIPTAARTLAEQIPQAAADAAGKQVLVALDRLHFSPSTLHSERQEALRDYLRGFDDHPVEIVFREGGTTIGANAFALPGRIVVLSDELIALADDESEILAVYLHEVGHLRGRHTEAMVIQGSLWLLILTLITGDISGVTDLLYALPSTLSQLAFSRHFEEEADTYAVAALNRHGRSAEPLATMLRRLTGTNQETGEADWLHYLSTHPGTLERIAGIRARDARNGSTEAEN